MVLGALSPSAGEVRRCGAAGSEGKMAAGSGAASGGHSGVRASAAALESSMDRRFQGVSNTMESIQGLSSWCIENKKHHSLVVRCWMKWLKKCELLTLLMNTHTQTDGSGYTPCSDDNAFGAECFEKYQGLVCVELQHVELSSQ